MTTLTTSPNSHTLSTISGFNGTGSSINPTLYTSASALEVKGELIVNGQNWGDRLDTIERVLMIPKRDIEMENQYSKLKEMYDAYMTELAKLKMWESLKGNNK